MLISSAQQCCWCWCWCSCVVIVTAASASSTDQRWNISVSISIIIIITIAVDHHHVSTIITIAIRRIAFENYSLIVITAVVVVILCGISGWHHGVRG